MLNTPAVNLFVFQNLFTIVGLSFLTKACIGNTVKWEEIPFECYMKALLWSVGLGLIITYTIHLLQSQGIDNRQDAVIRVFKEFLGEKGENLFRDCSVSLRHLKEMFLFFGNL